MKAIEFNTTVENNSIVLPQNQVDEIEGKRVKVVILYAESDETNEFNQLATEQFLKGYADEDAAYDNY